MTNCSETMGAFITGLNTFDLRFPTSLGGHGSDATNIDPDYSAAYVILHTDSSDGIEGHGFAFTIGRGNEVQAAAIAALAPHVIGLAVEDLCAAPGALYRRLQSDSQLRWLGPEKGVMQMAIAAVTNASWDLIAKHARKPLWKLLGTLSPQEIVALVDFQYLSDALTPQEAVALLEARVPQRAARIAEIEARGLPAYTTSPGWLNYSDETLASACKEAAAAGWQGVKIKVGRDADEDVRRCSIAREALGPSVRLMVDANQRWSAGEAIENMKRLARFDLGWIEEPTHPDDIEAHANIAKAIAPTPVATGEHIPNAIVFKQFIERGALGVAQIDLCRSGGVSDVITTMLLAAKHNIPVCPHAGGVGLCELVQHLAIFDYIAVAPSPEGRVTEFVDHLHEHFVDPVRIEKGRYLAPRLPGFSSTIRIESIERYSFPNGSVWRARRAM